MRLRTRDLTERLLLTLFLSVLCFHILEAIMAGASWVNGLVLVGEIMILGFVIFSRPAKEISDKLSDWILGFGGTAAPLFVQPGGTAWVSEVDAGILFMVGIALTTMAKLSLNRSFGIVPANRGVVTTGFYSVVRHPVYATYMIGHAAFFLLNPTILNAAVYGIGFALQVGRMVAEEDVLSHDPAYESYRHTVRYRLVPGIF